ncbi:gag-pol polyprotein [Hordeum vulgare]|nr:gag-pol polyprotein [Hordeum vulgare]
MKFHFMTGLKKDIAKIILTNNYKSLYNLFIGALKVEQVLKARATRTRAHFGMSKIHDYEHEDGTTKISKPNKIQDNNPKLNFTAIPVCGIDDAKSTTTIFKTTQR